MHHPDNTSKTVRLTPNPYPYRYDNIGRELDEYMRGPDFLNLVVGVLESASRLYQGLIQEPERDLTFEELIGAVAPVNPLSELESPRNWSIEQRKKYIETEVDSHRWRIDVCLVPNRKYDYRDQISSVVLVSCLVADLSGGNVRITVESHRPEGNPLVDSIWTVVQENWLGGIQDAIQPELDATSSSLSTVAKTKLQQRPWMQIPEDAGWHREAVKLWWQGYHYGDIEKQLRLTGKTVQNVFAQYRKDERYGNQVVPLASELREMGIRLPSK